MPFTEIVIHETKYAKCYFRLENENWVLGRFEGETCTFNKLGTWVRTSMCNRLAIQCRVMVVSAPKRRANATFALSPLDRKNNPLRLPQASVSVPENPPDPGHPGKSPR